MNTIELRFVKRAEMDNIAPRRILQQRTREPRIDTSDFEWNSPKIGYGPWSQWHDVPTSEA